jgi:capsular exopolysaccharide synthesis family protein
VKAVRQAKEQIEKQLKVAALIELGNMRDRYNALKIELDALEAAEYKWQAKNMAAARRLGELGRLNAAVGRFETQYFNLWTRLHDTKISEELKIEHINVVTPVNSTSRPVWPNPFRVLLVSVVVGLGSGFGLALAVQILDNKIQSIRDVEKTLGIPYLGGVPYWVHSGLERSIRPIVTEEHSTGAVEAYRALRTTIIGALNRINERIFFVTSADSREGKTLTVLNIAIMTAQMNKKVLLIDMDLRRGRLHRSLGLEREPGVSNVLKEGRALRDVIRPTKVENLYCAPTGSPIEDSAELLQSSDLMNMIVELQTEYDYICMDTSPVLRVTDTVIMATQGVGVVVYVARVNHTAKPLIKYSLDMLKDARVLGLIMNSIEMHKISSLYYTYQYPNYAYYSNAYAYGYNYYYYADRKERGKQQGGPRAPKRGLGRDVRRWLRRNLLPTA